MRIMNVGGRLAVAVDDGFVDVEASSEGRFQSSVQDVYSRWDEFREWVNSAGPLTADGPVPSTGLGAPAPIPAQVFAIGLNYRAHAQEGNLAVPDSPMVFTKFPSSITGPHAEIRLPDGAVDYEAELVVVIGRLARNVPEQQAWSYVAGVTAGQDLSERRLQLKPPAPQQFSLAKSFPGFSPIGPVLVTPDELADPDDLEISCRLSGEQLQHARTSEMIFSVPSLISYLSSILPLLPGDVIFTGTPDGVGFARDPQRLISAADTLETYVEGVGTMRHTFAA